MFFHIFEYNLMWILDLEILIHGKKLMRLGLIELKGTVSLAEVSTLLSANLVLDLIVNN